MKDYVGIANQYCRDVQDGKILACKQVRQATKRHLDDLERAKTDSFPYYFDPKKGSRIAHFAEQLPHIYGELAGEPLTLEPWQTWILASLYGWVKKEAPHYRRFTFAYIEVPRKNGKSFIGSAIGLYGLAADGESGAQVFSCGSTQKQSKEIWDVSKHQVNWTPDLTEALGVEAWSGSITVTQTASKYQPLTGKPKHGSNPSLALIDEIHQHRDSEILDTIRSGMKGRKQPLIVCLTTAGHDVNGVAYRIRQDLEKVLEGSVEDERFFGAIYTIDEDDDWGSDDAIRKANPNLDVSTYLSELQLERDRALRDPHLASVFKTYHLCVYQSAKNPYFDAVAFKELGDPSLKLEDFIGKPIRMFVGVDFAASQDLSCVSAIFEHEGKLHIFPKFFLPSDTADRVRNIPYREYEKQGFVTFSDGPVMDEELLADHMRYLQTHFHPEAFCFDRYGIGGTMIRLDYEGLNVIHYAQTVRNLSGGMKKLRDLIVLGEVVHDGNPLSVWNISNVISKPDKRNNDYPDKSRDENKIDMAVATIMPLKHWMDTPEITGDLKLVSIQLG